MWEAATAAISASWGHNSPATAAIEQVEERRTTAKLGEGDTGRARTNGEDRFAPRKAHVRERAKVRVRVEKDVRVVGTRTRKAEVFSPIPTLSRRVGWSGNWAQQQGPTDELKFAQSGHVNPTTNFFGTFGMDRIIDEAQESSSGCSQIPLPSAVRRSHSRSLRPCC